MATGFRTGSCANEISAELTEWVRSASSTCPSASRLRVDGELHHVQALDRVSFKVADGEIVALIGPSGCGKTTALRVAMGLDPANGGRVTVDGREVHGCGYDRGMVFQHAELLPWLSAMQNVMFGLEMKGLRGATLARHGEEISRAGGPHRFAEPPPASALRRHEAARRHRARARHRPVGAADGRAVRRARRADARIAAGRTAGNPRAHQEDHAVRHPRPRRGGADRRPHRGHAAKAACRTSSRCRSSVRAPT